MTKTSDDDIVTITALTTGLTVPSAPGESGFAGRVLLRGQTVKVNREDTLDRLGNTWLDLDTDAQIKRWGEQRFMIGTPTEADGITLGDDDIHGFRYRKWMAATEQARAISDPAERAAALAQVKRDFPEQGVKTQWTISERNL